MINSRFVVFALMALLISCDERENDERQAHAERLLSNSKKAKATIRYTGEYVFMHGGKFGKFQYKDHSDEAYYCLELTQLDDDKYYDLIPQYEVMENGAWRSIEIQGSSTEPVVVRPGEEFVYYAAYEPIEGFPEGTLFRKSLGKLKSEPFQITEKRGEIEVAE